MFIFQSLHPLSVPPNSGVLMAFRVAYGAAGAGGRGGHIWNLLSDAMWAILGPWVSVATKLAWQLLLQYLPRLELMVLRARGF